MISIYWIFFASSRFLYSQTFQKFNFNFLLLKIFIKNQNCSNENVTLAICKKKNVVFLNQFIQWIQIFEIHARMQKKFFEILMHLMRIKNLNLWMIHDFERIIKILTIINVFKIFEFVIFERSFSIIVYLNWLWKLNSQKQKCFILIMKFIFSKIVNAIINWSLMWNEEIHVCERLLHNHNVKHKMIVE